MQAPGQVQRGSREGSGGSGEGLGGFGGAVRFNRDPEKVPEKVWEALVQSQVPGSLGAKPSQVQRVPEKVEVLPRHTAIAKTVYIYITCMYGFI